MAGKQSLQTVVMTDVAGFTEMMRTNEPLALQYLRTDIELIRGHINRNGGEVVKVAGDGILALFSSAPSAVRACIESQEALSDSTLKHRMAIHAGEITRTDGDAYGDAVNVCSRLETITTPGTVIASRIVIDLVEAQGLPQPVRRGKVQLKGIDVPVDIYCWGSGAKKRFDLRRFFLAAGLVVFLSVVAWQFNVEKGFRAVQKKESPTALVSNNMNAEAEAPNIDEFMDQAFDEVWQEIEEYDAVKLEAIEKVDAQIVIEYLKTHPLGRRERGQLELSHWRLIDRAVKKGKEIVGPKASADQILKALTQNPKLGMDLEIDAFSSEFRRPK